MIEWLDLRHLINTKGSIVLFQLLLFLLVLVHGSGKMWLAALDWSRLVDSLQTCCWRSMVLPRGGLLCCTQWSHVPKPPEDGAEDANFVWLDLRLWADIQRHEHQQILSQIQVNWPASRSYPENYHNQTHSRLWCIGQKGILTTLFPLKLWVSLLFILW